MNLPNKLTMFRIFLVIPLIICFSLFIWSSNNNFLEVNTKSNSQYFLYVAGIIFVISMIIDFFDWYLARKHNQITSFGKLFDPLADKIITTTSLIFLSIFNYTYLILVLIFIIRDLIVDGSRNIAAYQRIKIEASIYGKLKTIFQSIAIPLVIFLSPLINKNNWWEVFLINIPMILATLMSIISGVFYFKQIIPFINNK